MMTFPGLGKTRVIYTEWVFLPDQIKLWCKTMQYLFEIFGLVLTCTKMEFVLGTSR